jgi:hypothetical protein
MTKAYYLTEDDVRFLSMLKRMLTATPTSIYSSKSDDDRPYVARVKPGTTITPMSVIASPGPGEDRLVPGEGVVVLWSPRLKIDNPAEEGSVKPLLRKLNKRQTDPAALGQDVESHEDDWEVKVWNYTPYEVFDIGFISVQPTRDGMLCVTYPPDRLYVAKKGVGDIQSMHGQECQLGYANPEVREEGEATDIVWLEDEDGYPLKRVCFHIGPGIIDSAEDTLMLVRVDPHGTLIIDTVFCEG